jgi:hypothetical protein
VATRAKGIPPFFCIKGKTYSFSVSSAVEKTVYRIINVYLEFLKQDGSL